MEINTLIESDWKIRDYISKIVYSNCREVPYEGTEIDKSHIINQFFEFLQNQKLEFAKLHVKAALKAASEKAETEYEPHWSGEQEGSTYINKESILNAYPLENIK